MYFGQRPDGGRHFNSDRLDDGSVKRSVKPETVRIGRTSCVFRSGRENRSDVWARVRLHGELRRVGCVREDYNVPSGVGVRIDGDVFGTITPFDQRGGYRRGADRHP